MRRRLRRGAVVVGLALGIIVAAPAVASAHPLGNFTVNRYAGIRVGADAVSVDYVVDMAEIPTFQTRPSIDRNGDDTISRREASAYGASACTRITRKVDLTVDGAAVGVSVRDHALSFLPGQAGLTTLRLECRLDAPVATSSASRTVAFRDRNESDRVGWREITAIGDGTTLRHSTVPPHSLSRRLTVYPQDRLQSPLDQRSFRATVEPGGATPAIDSPLRDSPNPVSRGFDDLTDWFTGTVGRRDLTLGLALVALAVGILLGAMHAVVPGHGKTVMAAYLVGERGSVRDGLLIGVTVAATHTAGVLLLGLFLTASQAFAPESVYPWLTAISGIAFAGLGVSLLLRALRRRHQYRAGFLAHAHHHHGALDGHLHPHDHNHDHNHDREHDHVHDHAHAHAPRVTMSRRDLVTLGMAGGLVPTPSAIVVLLGATAIGRAWFGVLLVVAYGVGMAATLVAAGLVLAWARRRFDVRAKGERLMRWAALLPIGTACVVIASGLAIMARAAGQA